MCPRRKTYFSMSGPAYTPLRTSDHVMRTKHLYVRLHTERSLFEPFFENMCGYTCFPNLAPNAELTYGIKLVKGPKKVLIPAFAGICLALRI